MASENGGRRTVSASVGTVDDLAVDSMRMASVGEHRVAVIRTRAGIHALDNACPHQGYGLVTGSLTPTDDGDGLVTCQWHNWKFRASDGVCVMGEEDVACHPVTVDDDGSIVVTVTEPTSAERRAALWPSLVRGIEADYVGQISRDSVRLLDAGATPAEIMWEGLAISAAKAEDGVGHEMAMAADCLHLSELWSGDDQALALVQGLAGISEVTRHRSPTVLPSPDPASDLPAAIESEDVTGAMAATLGLIEAGAEAAVVRHQFLDAVSRHHLSYGHGAIYTQKAFELLDRVGWDKAPRLLPHLAETLTYATREDTLPYMRKAMRALDAVDLEALAATADRDATGWDDPEFVDTLLTADEAPIDAAVRAAHDGAGVEGLLDAVSVAVSERLLRHDLDVELDRADDFGWLDITHGLTYARAARWAWQHDPGPHTARLALFTVWLAFDTGRSERRHGTAVSRHEAGFEPSGVVADVLAAEPEAAGERLAREALDDRAGSFIVAAHLVKTAQAAREEAAFTGTSLPLAAAARFIHAPRLERFVARSVHESSEFVRTGKPPRR